MAEIVIVAGPNGAGKSTFARYTLPVEMPFLNADEIAKTLPNNFNGNREVESGRQLLQRMDAFTAEKRSFALETTLASRSLAPDYALCRVAGIQFLFSFFVPSPELFLLRKNAGMVQRKYKKKIYGTNY